MFCTGGGCDGRVGETLARGNPLLTPLSRPLICSLGKPSFAHSAIRHPLAHSNFHPSSVDPSLAHSLVWPPLARIHYPVCSPPFPFLYRTEAFCSSNYGFKKIKGHI